MEFAVNAVLFSSMAFLLLWRPATGASVNKTEMCTSRAEMICICGGSPLKIDVKMCKTESSRTCNPCDERLADADVCDRFKWCETCDLDALNCRTCPEGRSGDFCEKADVEPSQRNQDSGGYLRSRAKNVLEDLETYPRNASNSEAVASNVFEFTIYAGQGLNDRVRKREEEECDLKGCRPPSLEAADLHCTVTERDVTCSQRCIWGHKMEKRDRITMEWKCDVNTHTWSPGNIEDCKPYVKCHVKFVDSVDAKSKMKCNYNIDVAPPTCDIDCGGGFKTYSCNLDGTWFPSLPKCAELDYHDRPDDHHTSYWCEKC